MNISLTPELENVVRTKVASGLYNNASEVEWLARVSAIGFAQLESGQTVEVESEQHFIALVRGEARTVDFESR